MTLVGLGLRHGRTCELGRDFKVDSVFGFFFLSYWKMTDFLKVANKKGHIFNNKKWTKCFCFIRLYFFFWHNRLILWNFMFIFFSFGYALLVCLENSSYNFGRRSYKLVCKLWMRTVQIKNCFFFFVIKDQKMKFLSSREIWTKIFYAYMKIKNYAIF